MFCTRCDDSIEVLEARLFEDTGIQVVFEVAVVNRDADAVQSERLEECSIGFGKKVFKELKINTIVFVDV